MSEKGQKRCERTKRESRDRKSESEMEKRE
jgi:hypothetical protein